MAGAFGSIKHIHEDYSLTFGDVKKLISDIGSNSLDVYEKFDGQNLMITFKDNMVKCARNKKSLIDPMSVYELGAFYQDKEFLQKSFTDALIEMESHFEFFTVDELNTFFRNGQVYLNTEIINPVTRNIIDYGDDFKVIITGAISTDGNGNQLSHLTLDTLQWLFVDSGFRIEPYNKLEYAVNVDSYVTELNNFMYDENVNDSNKISDYIGIKLGDIINGFQLTTQQKSQLKNRWIKNDKSLKLNHINYGLSFHDIKIFETFKLESTINAIAERYKSIIRNLGFDLLKSIADKHDRMQNINAVIDLYISSLESAAKLNKDSVNIHIQSIKQLGLGNVVNMEGIVFTFNDKLYKFVGLFQPINQICGIVRYSK